MTPRKIWVARSQTAIACSQPSLIHSPAALYYPTGGRFVSSSSSRLAYIDWMRGLACVLMFQTHCYDSWLGDGARKSTFFMWSQLGGTLPAPLFLFLAGISFALVVDKLRQKELAAAHTAAVDNLASELASVAAGIVHQRRAQSGRTPAVALPDFSLDQFCFCWPGCRPIPVKLLGTQAQHPDTRVDRGRRNRAYLSGT